MKVEKRVCIMQLNDLHGYMEEHYEYLYDGSYTKMGGLPRIKTYLEDMQIITKDNILILDNGDTFHGTYPVIKSKGKVLTKLMNFLEIDAMTAHWEFAYGVDGFKEITKELDYPMLAINVFDKDSDELVFDPYLIKEIDGIKFGVIGIASNIVDKVMPPHFSEGIYFDNGESLPKYIKELRNEKAVDVIIVLSHLGFPQDVELAKNTSDIDVIVSGHTHNRLSEPVVINNTFIMQSGCHGSFLGHLNLYFDENNNITKFFHQLVPLLEDTENDGEMEMLLNIELRPYKDKMQEVIGETKTGLNRNFVLESTMDNFLLKAILDYTKADVAFSNGWRYGAAIPPGKITFNDIFNIIPTNPKVSKVTLTGSEIKEMMEENLERTFAKEPFNQMGGYVKRMYGMKMFFKIENPAGYRIHEIYIGDELLDEYEEYDVAFVTVQGVPAKYGRDRHDLDIHIIDLLIDYVKKEKVVSAEIMNNVVAI